jgi:N-glycosylase/DNA lyase
LANFDKKPEYRLSVKADMFWVYFASILSVAGVIGVILIGKRIKKVNK